MSSQDREQDAPRPELGDEPASIAPPRREPRLPKGATAAVPDRAPARRGTQEMNFMDNVEQDRSQPFGLDIGTSRIVVARNVGRKDQFEAELNAFITLPYSELTEGLLVREEVFYEVAGSEFIVAGDDQQKFAEIFHVETRRPMVNGALNRAEPHSLGVIRRIIGKLVGKAGTPGQKVRFSVPAPLAETGKEAAYHHELLFKELLAELGYDAKPIDEGLAVVCGELGSSNYTGFGISFGSGLCNACLAVLSIPVMSFSVLKAGDYIDRQAATATGESATRLRVHKEQSFQLNGFTGDRVDNVLTVYYDDVILSLTDSLRAMLSSAQRPKMEQSIPLVIAGGTSMPKGFLDRFEKALRTSEFPLQLSEIRLSSDPLNSTARGALVAALSEQVHAKAVSA